MYNNRYVTWYIGTRKLNNTSIWNNGKGNESQQLDLTNYPNKHLNTSYKINS